VAGSVISPAAGRRSVTVLAVAALSLMAVAMPARAASGPSTTSSRHALPATVSTGIGAPFAMGDPADPSPLPAPLTSSGGAQVQALVQQYQRDAQADQQKYNQLAAEKGTLQQRAGDVQNRESTLATQASNLESQETTLSGQIDALNNAIDAHNAEPHTFQLPEQASELAAYDEEKANLDAQQASLRNQADALKGQADKLQSDEARANADEEQLNTDIQTHNDAVSELQADAEKLATERQQILAKIAQVLADEENAAEDSDPGPAVDGDDASEPPGAADPPAQTQQMPSGGGDESAPPRESSAPTGTGQTAPGQTSGSNPPGAGPTQPVTRAPVQVRLAPSTVSKLPADQAENLNPSQTYDGLAPEGNGDYEAFEEEPPAGTTESPSQKAFDDAINNGGKATTTVGGKPATVDRIVEEPAPAESQANQGGDSPRPAQTAPPQPRGLPTWVPRPSGATSGDGPPVSIDALRSMLDGQGLGAEADQYDFEYSPTILDKDGNPAYAEEPTDAAGNPELGADGKPVMRFSNLGLQNPQVAQETFEDEVLDDEPTADEPNAEEAPCPEHSFSGGTRVLMADGAAEPIADVKVGDLVRNAAPGGSGEVHAVEQVHVTTTDTAFTDVAVTAAGGADAGASGGTVTGTSNHPYYDASAGGFVDAGALHVGDRLQSADGGQATVGGVRAHVGPLVTYDLTIDGPHTYYVVAGDTPVLVHNVCLEALKDWTSQRYRFGNRQFLLDKSDMTHILTRHMPKYWDGSVKQRQSFFGPDMSVSDVEDAIAAVLKQNRGTLIGRGTNGMYQIQGTYDGEDYVLGLKNGHIRQFYPGELKPPGAGAP